MRKSIFNSYKTWIILTAVALVCTGIFLFFSNNHSEEDNKILTYGKATDATSIDELPDLIAVIGKSGKEGYIYKSDYLGETIGNYENYTVALSESELKIAREQNKTKYSNVSEVDFYKRCYDVPVYDNTGKTEIDKFVMQNGGYNAYPSTEN